jgi:predicted amidophosphoribosyltransferase
VEHPERLQGKHILIVDDVLTSGATLYACMLAIRNAVPDVRLSFATLAVTQHITQM